jgi:hypothetical protein
VDTVQFGQPARQLRREDKGVLPSVGVADREREVA